MLFMLRTQKGFTLVELMIVVVVIALLASIAVPAYTQLVSEADTKACMGEAKAYANAVVYALYSPENMLNMPPAPVAKACASITNASSWRAETAGKIIAISKKESVKISCDIPIGAPCAIVP